MEARRGAMCNPVAKTRQLLHHLSVRICLCQRWAFLNVGKGRRNWLEVMSWDELGWVGMKYIDWNCRSIRIAETSTVMFIYFSLHPGEDVRCFHQGHHGKCCKIGSVALWSPSASKKTALSWTLKIFVELGNAKLLNVTASSYSSFDQRIGQLSSIAFNVQLFWDENWWQSQYLQTSKSWTEWIRAISNECW